MGKRIIDPNAPKEFNEDGYEGFTLSGRVINIYEPHGYFKFNDYWIMYGHEEIVVCDLNGIELKREHTR